MDTIDTREWLLTNGLGGFASGTVCDAHTRTYHGWLIAALDPPSQRTLLLSRIDATVEVGGQGADLGTNFWVSGTIAPTGYQLLRSFQMDPVPTWVWGQDQWQLSREIVMPYGLMPAAIAPSQPQFCNRVLIRYRYDGTEPAVLKLRPLISDRGFHYQQHANPDLHFSQVVESQCILLQSMRPNRIGIPWQLSWTQGHYEPDAVWYWSYRYPEETQRGLNDREDLYSPGYLTVILSPGESLTVEARVNPPGPHQACPVLEEHTVDQVIQTEQRRLAYYSTPLLECVLPVATSNQSSVLQLLLRAADQFIAYRASISGPTVIAGYHWFNDWGRDTLIALPGLALTTQRFALARGLLETFGHYCQDGLIPNTFPDAGSKPAYNSLDAALWWIETLGLYLEATQDWEFLRDQYPMVHRIYKSFLAGTSYSIRVDAMDGLVTWDAPGIALTWMDAVVDGQPVTPRRGKPVEINALWYSALCWAQRWATQLQQTTRNEEEATRLGKQARRYAQQADQVKASLQKFWNADRGYFYDRIEPDDRPNPDIRPNAVIALSLYHCGFAEPQARRVLQIARDHLLTPYGLRSLDPGAPTYVGRYTGNICQRDRAYHQGTVWSWLIGPFIRAWQRFYPTEPLPWNGSALLVHLQQQAGLGSISEIFDGDAPHEPQGAIAQAWSVAELLRHWHEVIP